MFARPTLLPLVCAACAAFAEPREITLVELIEALRAQGVGLVYSSALVDPGQRVLVESTDLEALKAALAELGLALEAREGVWVITRAVGANLEPPTAAGKRFATPVLENVIVTGTLHRFPHTGTAASHFGFSAEDLATLPTLGSDALRSTLRLPGVSSSGVSAKPRVRGGLQDELLVLQDGVELLEPFHLADYHSAYSSIDYLTIESLEFYTGGFPSRYGSRMSGVMDIGNRWQDSDYSTHLGYSTFAAFAHTRGRFGEQHPTDWLLSYRQGDLQDLTDYIDSRSGNPEYQDVSARLKTSLTPSLSLDGGIVYADDDIRFEDEEERAFSKIANTYAWLGAEWEASESLAGRATLSALDFNREKGEASFEADEEDPGKGGFLEYRQEVKRAALRNDWTRLAGPMRWEFGWQLEYNRAEYRQRARIDRGDLAAILGTPQEIERDLEASPRGWSGGAYLQLEADLSEQLTLQPSLRWDFQDYYCDRGSESQFSPRLGLAYWWSEHSLLRLSLGRFYQQEGIQELQLLDGETRFFKPQHSDQVVGGWQWRGDSLKLSAELYYKRYGKPKKRYENIFNPFVLLPEMEPDRVPLRPDRAEARGVDLDLRKSLLEPLEGFARYSFMDARDRIDGEWVDRRWSQTHTVNTGLVWRGDSYRLSLALVWHSGWRSSELPGFVAEDTVVPLVSVLNNIELDDYFSLDFSARKHWDFSRARVEIYADIVNVTDHDNLAGVDFDVEEVEGGFSLVPDRATLLGKVPSVGIILSF